jgi:hypothetical protein
MNLQAALLIYMNEVLEGMLLPIIRLKPNEYHSPLLDAFL